VTPRLKKGGRLILIRRQRNKKNEPAFRTGNSRADIAADFARIAERVRFKAMIARAAVNHLKHFAAAR
jgi:hypothetical protein